MKEIKSKYQRKNYQELTFNLDEYSCHRCGNVFLIDIDMCQDKYEDDQARPYKHFFCPYCGKENITMV